MARPRTQQKDILARVSDLGAEALNKLSDIPGGSRVVELANESKTRLDEMQKKLRGLDALEKRVAKLERELAKKPAASKSGSTTARKRTTSTRKPSTAKKPSA